MQAYYQERVRAMQARATELPKELLDLDARLERLRDRLKKGDPDMAADELQAAIDRAEGKRQELEAQQPAAKASARVFAMVPRAAELFRQQVQLGLEGNPGEGLRARSFLRGLFVDGKIVMSPGDDGSLWARYSMQPAVLLKAAGTDGRGEAVCAVPVIPVSVRVK